MHTSSTSAHLQLGKFLFQVPQEGRGHIWEDLRQRGGHAAVEGQQVRRPRGSLDTAL